jgi:hypothetical protein
MQRTAALQRIDKMRFDVRPKSNQLTAIGNSTDSFFTDDSRGVEVAFAASTHAGHEEAKEERSINPRESMHGRTMHKKISLMVDSVDQLNFEFKRNKNSMGVFTIRLRRVYQA